MRRFKYVFLALIFYSVQVFATKSYFSSLRYENGLPSNVTNSIVQDNDGFIWIGTDEGLCRYDGHTMLYFNKETSNQLLPSNRISSLLLDGDYIWVGTWDKLCTIHTKTFEIKAINTGELDAYRALYKDSNGKIWIGTNDGLIVFNKEKNEYHFYNTENSNISHNTIRSFCEDRYGNMWIGTFNGLNLFDGEQFINYDLKQSYKPEINNNLVIAIQKHRQIDNLLWVGTETGLCLFNTSNGQYENYNSENSALSNEVIKSIHISDNQLWLGTDYGLNIFNVNNQEIKTFYHNPQVNYSICNNVIWEIFKDSNNLLWFITSNGISLLKNTNDMYELHEVLYNIDGQKAGNLIRDLIIMPDGTKWFATIHGVRCERSNGTIETFTSKGPKNKRLLIDNVYALQNDKWGRMWIGTAGGINIWDPRNQKMHAITSNDTNGLSSNYISRFTSSTDGQIWVSAWEGGLFHMNGNIKDLKNIRFKKITTDGEALSVYVHDKLYYCTENKLFSFDPIKSKSKIVIELPSNDYNNEIHGLISSPNGNVWMANRSGLYLWSDETKKLSQYLFPNPTSIIMGMEIDNNGAIWCSTHNSILKFDQDGNQNLTIPLNNNTPIKSYLSRSSFISSSGFVYFGGQNGYIKIDPNFQYSLVKKPRVRVSGLSINNKPLLPRDKTKILKHDITYTKDLVLKHSNNSLTFQFSNLDFWLPEKNSFQYQLIGYDKTWQYTSGERNFAIYSNLKPGNYKLKVIGINHKGLLSDTSVPISFVIKPSIWLSNIFLILYTILIIGIIYLVFYILNYRNRLTNKLKITQLEKEHSEQLFNIKQQFFTNISHEFRTPLSLIAPPIKEVLKTGQIDENSRRMLRLADKNSHRLLSLINQILDFRKLEKSKLILQKSPVDINKLCLEVFDSFSDLARRNEIDYQYKAFEPHQTVIIDSLKIESILFNILSNAFKHTSLNGKITFVVSLSNDFINISIRNNGIGIEKTEQKRIFERFYQGKNNETNAGGTGVGLTLSMEYAKLHKGTITVDSELNEGACFTLTLPFRNIKTDVLEKKTNKLSITKSEIINTDHEKELALNAKRILIIDDNPDILEFLELNLYTQYKIETAINGQEGIQKAIKLMPNLIISDVMMPIMDGFTMCQSLKQHQQTMHIPIILLTAKNLDQQKLEGVKSGADLYITKPFEIEFLLTCIQNLFQHEQYLLQYTKNLLILSSPKEIQEDNNQDTIFLKRVMTIVEENLNNSSFSVETLSNDIGISTTHLYRKLKTLTGLSTQDIIKNYRLEKAANLIVNNEGNITEVMYAVGFSSLSTFSKAFKVHYGKSPSDYARNYNT